MSSQLASSFNADPYRIEVDWELALTRPQTRQALTYWRRLCGTRKMPRRNELGPRAMLAFLPHVNLVEIVADPARGGFDYVVRLQGQHTIELHGPVAHRKLSEAVPAQSAQRWRFCFDAVREAARPARFTSRIRGKPWLGGEMLVAPLGNGEVESLFCVLASWPADNMED